MGVRWEFAIVWIEIAQEANKYQALFVVVD